MNRGEEDYLKGMYKLQGVFEEEVFIKTKELMTLFGHSLPSVNEMVKRLQEEGFVSYKLCGGFLNKKRISSRGETHQKAQTLGAFLDSIPGIV